MTPDWIFQRPNWLICETGTVYDKWELKLITKPMRCKIADVTFLISFYLNCERIFFRYWKTISDRMNVINQPLSISSQIDWSNDDGMWRQQRSNEEFCRVHELSQNNWMKFRRKEKSLESFDDNWREEKTVLVKSIDFQWFSDFLWHPFVFANWAHSCTFEHK